MSDDRPGAAVLAALLPVLAEPRQQDVARLRAATLRALAARLTVMVDDARTSGSVAPC